MPCPPVPESPNRQKVPSKSSGTPRVGMHLYQNDEDDDVSVLTFNTIGVRETASNNHLASSVNYVKSARENLERLVLDSKNSGDDGGGDDDDAKSLSRISEEGGSQMSSCYSKRSRGGSDPSSPCKTSSVMGTEEGQEKISTAADEECSDDDITVAESILDEANNRIQSILSSPYYSGKGKKASVPAHESPSPQPYPKNPSPMKQPLKSAEAAIKGKETEVRENVSKHASGRKGYYGLPPKKDSEKDAQPGVSNRFLRSYFNDENSKSSISTLNQKKHDVPSSKYDPDKKSKAGSSQVIQQLESETNRLQMILKERQLASKKATKEVGSSIQKANMLLERISAGRTKKEMRYM